MKTANRLLCGVLVLLAIFAGPQALGQEYRRKSLGAADTIPMKVIGGGQLPTITLGQLNYRQLVLYVFDSRCSDCRQQLVYLQRLQKSFLKGQSVQVIAIEVMIGKDVDTAPAPETEGLLSLADVDGRLWTALLASQAVDSPPGAKAKADRVLPLTMFVGSWAVRHRGSERMPIDKYVRRRTMLLTRVALPTVVPDREVDIEDEHALQFGFSTQPGVTPFR